MTEAIKLYWWRGSAAVPVNLGDEISRQVVEYAAGRQAIWSDIGQAELLAIGSVLHFPQAQKTMTDRKSPYVVWGSGTLAAAEVLFQEKFLVSALRGPLTHSLMGYSGAPACGDPGILAAQIWQPVSAKVHAWGIVPHHSHLKSDWVARVMEKTPNCVLIDVTDPDIGASMQRISGCERVAATSLHGLVLADAYRIPNVWLSDGSLHGAGSWKFLDYFSGVQRRLGDSIPTVKVTNLDDIDMDRFSFTHFAKMDEIGTRLLKAFPI